MQEETKKIDSAGKTEDTSPEIGTGRTEPEVEFFQANKNLRLAFASLAILILIVSLDGTIISVSLAVSCIKWM